MAVNRGKDFEEELFKQLDMYENISIIRLHDQTNGFKGSKNPCDFIMYSKPNMFALELKTTHADRLSFSNITDYQWDQLTKMQTVKGVIAGIICWYVDRDTTLFIPISILNELKQSGEKSISYKACMDIFEVLPIYGKKRRVFFDYDWTKFISQARIIYGS